MKTDDLIRAMAADATPARPVEAALPLALALSAAFSGAVYLLQAGIRPDLGEALTHGRVIVKQIFPWLLAIGGLGAVLRLSRPGAEIGGWIWVLIAVPALLLAAAIGEILTLPPELWGMAARGKSTSICLTVIPLMSLPILAASLWALRRGAPTRPALTGAVAGLMSAGAAAALYAFWCTDDSPFFYTVRYGAAILIVTAIAALVGRRILRW
jgi:hypothetical protein